MIQEHVQVTTAPPRQPVKGSAGLRAQLAGQATTVSNAALATGGIGRGKLITRDTK